MLKGAHKKIFVVSILFFLIEAFVMVFGNAYVMRSIAWGSAELGITFRDGQQQAIDTVNMIHKNNKEQRPGLYFFGGSVTRSLLCEGQCGEDDARAIEDKTGVRSYMAVVATQQPAGVLRLVDNINVPASTIVMTIAPRKMLISSSPQNLLYSKYMYGAGYRYPATSPAANRLFDELSITATRTSLKLAASLNIIFYLAKDFAISDKPKKKKDKKKAAEPDMKLTYENIGRDRATYNDAANTLARLRLNFEILGRTYENARSKGMKMVLFDLPYSELRDRHLGDVIGAYNKHLEAFKVKYPEVRHYRLPRDTYDTKTEHFSDGFHLLESGREYYRKYLYDGIRFSAGSVGTG